MSPSSAALPKGQVPSTSVTIGWNRYVPPDGQGRLCLTGQKILPQYTRQQHSRLRDQSSRRIMPIRRNLETATRVIQHGPLVILGSCLLILHWTVGRGPAVHRRSWERYMVGCWLPMVPGADDAATSLGATKRRAGGAGTWLELVSALNRGTCPPSALPRSQAPTSRRSNFKPGTGMTLIIPGLSTSRTIPRGGRTLARAVRTIARWLEWRHLKQTDARCRNRSQLLHRSTM